MSIKATKEERLMAQVDELLKEVSNLEFMTSRWRKSARLLYEEVRAHAQLETFYPDSKCIEYFEETYRIENFK